MHHELKQVAEGSLKPKSPADYGFDHYRRDASGKVVEWMLIPSRTIVDAAGLKAWQDSRPKRTAPKNDCLGLSWEEIEAKQGGKLRR